MSLPTLSSEERLRRAPFLTVLMTHSVSRSFPLTPQRMPASLVCVCVTHTLSLSLSLSLPLSLCLSLFLAFSCSFCAPSHNAQTRTHSPTHHSNTRATCRHAALLEEALLRRAGYTPREHYHPPPHSHTETAHKHTHTHTNTHTAAQSTGPLIEDRK